MKSKKFRVLFIYGMISMFLLSFLFNSKISLAQYNGITLTTPTNLHMIELADNIDTQESNSSIKIPLPSSTWNV
ncbi:MAG: hypothetical protein ACFFEO_11085, partial [Candidatus Thorarchaeota archaeon]